MGDDSIDMGYRVTLTGDIEVKLEGGCRVRPCQTDIYGKTASWCDYSTHGDVAEVRWDIHIELMLAALSIVHTC